MTEIIAVTRAVNSGGRGLGWVFFVPVTLVAVYLINTLVMWRGRAAGLEEVGAAVAVVIFCVLLWYFLIGRIPNWIAVRNLRHQIVGATVVYGADVFTRPRRSSRFAARFAGSAPNVVVLTRQGVQLWAGRGDSVRPIKYWEWSDIQNVTATGPRYSSLVDVLTKGNPVPFEFCLINNRSPSALRIRGKARSRVLAEFERARANE